MFSYMDSFCLHLFVYFVFYTMPSISYLHLNYQQVYWTLYLNDILLHTSRITIILIDFEDFVLNHD